MAQTWTDLGNDQWKLTITDESNRVPPAHVTGTKEEIIAKLANSKINGDARIAELKGSSIAPGERMKLVTDLQNPATAPEAITKVVETIVGPVAEFQRDRDSERLERQRAKAVEAAQTFADTTDGWFPSEYNKKTLTEYMQRMGMSHSTVSDYKAAFAALSAANLLQLPPEDEDDDELEAGTTQTPPADRPAVATAPKPPVKTQAPTRYSTTIRSSDASGTQTRPTTRLKYTREQIAKMSTSKMRELMNDPDFIKANEYYAARPVQQRAS